MVTVLTGEEEGDDRAGALGGIGRCKRVYEMRGREANGLTRSL
jgi:hypothetical protein